MRIELLYFDGCPSQEAFLPRLRELLAEAGLGEDELELRRVETVEEAEAERFLGSPTLRVEGHDVEPGAASRSDFGMKCRIYRSPSGVSSTPPEDWVADALGRRR